MPPLELKNALRFKGEATAPPCVAVLRWALLAAPAPGAVGEGAAAAAEFTAPGAAGTAAAAGAAAGAADWRPEGCVWGAAPPVGCGRDTAVDCNSALLRLKTTRLWTEWSTFAVVTEGSWACISEMHPLALENS